MKYFFDHTSDILSKKGGIKNFLLLIDFDGTLSPIAPTPQQAVLPSGIQSLIRKCSTFFPVVIVSGRALDDVKKMIDLKKVIYAGGHGMAWQIGGRRFQVPVHKETIAAVRSVKKKLKRVVEAYPGMYIEDKRISLAIHYRQVDRARVTSCKREIRKMVTQYLGSNGLRLLKGKEMIELLPHVDWNKGTFSKYIQKYLQTREGKKFIPVYIGDDITDEDAFAALSSGITVRVGKSSRSRATYFIKHTGQVALVLQWLLGNSVR